MYVCIYKRTHISFSFVDKSPEQLFNLTLLLREGLLHEVTGVLREEGSGSIKGASQAH